MPAQVDGRAVLDLPGEGAFDLADAESPRFVGRGVVALAADPSARSFSGRAVTTLVARRSTTASPTSTVECRASSIRAD